MRINKSFHCLLLTVSLLLSSCAVSETRTVEDEEVKKPMPLNVTVFLDLSDRLVREMTPTQSQRDIEVIDHLVDLFIKDCQVNGRIIGSKNHFQVLFYPSPNNSDISNLARGLNVDLSKISVQEKKNELKTMKDRFNTNLSQIYSDAITDKKWVGCDIWGFFSNKDVDAQCIRDGYRNILVILTDGYLYHVANKQKDGNAYSYVLPQTLANPNSSLIVKRKGLDNLEVMMLEVNPYQPTQREQLVNVLENWFMGMGVSRFVVSETALPVNTENVIDAFFK